MSNVFINLPVLSGDGPAAGQDCSGMVPERTISVDGGAFAGSLVLEGSNDGGATWDGVHDVLPVTGPTTTPVAFVGTYQQMRISRKGSSGGAVGSPTVTIAGAGVGSASVFGVVPAPSGGQGIGAAIDLTAGGDVNTFVCAGNFTGQVQIQISTDGTNFSGGLLFLNRGVQTFLGTIKAARLNVVAILSGSLPVLSVGSGSNAGGGSGGFPGFGGAPPAVALASAAGSSGLASNSDHTHAGVTSVTAGAGIAVTGAANTPTIANTGVTSITAGSGISVSGATGAVTVTATGGGGGITALTGDGTASGSGSVVFTLATVNANVGTFTYPSVTVNAKGLVTAISSQTPVTSAVAGTGIGVSGATGAVTFTNTGVTSIVAGTNITISGATGAVTINATGGGGGGITALTGDGTASGSGSVVFTLATVNANVGTFTYPSVTVNAKGLVTAISSQTPVTSIVAGTGISISGATGAVTVNATGTSFPGFGGAPPAIASASAAGTASTASRSDHTHALDLVAYNPSLAGMQATGVVQQTYGAPTATPAVLNVASTRIPFGASGLLTTSANFIFNTGVAFSATVPFVGWSATAAVANSSNVMRYSTVPGAVASGAGHTLDAYVYDAVTVNVTGTSAFGPVALIHVNAPTYNQTGASTINVATTMQIDPPVKSGTGSWTMSAALYINDPNATGNANLIVNDNIYTPSIIGASGLGDQPLNFAVVGTDTMSWLSGVALDGSGGHVEGTLNSGIWSLGRTAAVGIDTSGNVQLGSATIAVGTVNGYPYMPQIAGIPTSAPAVFGNAAAFGFDSNDHLFFIRNVVGSQWEACPTFNSTATAGAQTAVLTNLPTAVVSTTPKWWTFKTPAGTTTYIPYFQ